MAPFTSILTFLAYLCSGAADITINTEAPENTCLKSNNSRSMHVVNNIILHKCCPLGQHLNPPEDVHGSATCIEGNANVAIDLVFIVDNATMHDGILLYDPLQLKDYSVRVSTLFTGYGFQFRLKSLKI
jgi:hypothetical protein